MGALGSVVQAAEDATATYASDVWTRFDTAAEPVVLAVGTLTLVVMGYLLLTGQLSLTPAQFFPRLFRWVVMVVLLFNMPDIFGWAFAFVTDIPNAVAIFLLSGGPIADEAGVIGLIEAVMTAGIDAASTIWLEASWSDIGSHVLSGLLLLTGLVLAILAAVLLMVSKLGVGILLAVGPFFLLLRLLDVGKGLFEGWLRQLLTFAIIPIFVYSLIALNFGILTSAHTQLTAAAASAAGVTFTSAIPYLFVALVNMVLLTQVMGWAGGVGGGIALAVSAGGVLAGISTAARLSRATTAATQKAVAVGAPLATAAGRAAMRTLGRGGG